MQLTTYLFFRDEAKAAFEFYAACLGGKIVDQANFGDMPDGSDMPDEAKDLMANICLQGSATAC